MGNKTTRSELSDEGFELVDNDADMIKPKKKLKPEIRKSEKAPAPIIIIDNKELIKAVNNEALTRAIIETNLLLQNKFDSLVKSLKEKPSNFTLNIKRDERGFMTSVDVKIIK